MYKIVAIMGKAGSGKSSLLDWLTSFLELRPNNKFNIVLTTTTRPKRTPDETGYHFMTEEQMSQHLSNGQMAEVSMFRDWFYGTSWADLKKDKINVGVFNPSAIKNLEKHPNITIYKIYVACPDQQRLLRQLQRKKELPKEDVQEIVRRYLADEEDFTEAAVGAYAVLQNWDNRFLEVVRELWDILDKID